MFQPLQFISPRIIVAGPLVGLILMAGCATQSGPKSPLPVASPTGPEPETVAGADRLKAPAGFYAPAVRDETFSDCPDMSTPHTGPLDFPSKYQGSDAARDDLNQQAEATYRQQVEGIRELERGINRLVEDYLHSADPAAVNCALDWMLEWARMGGLTGEVTTHTGKSVRKWALGSVGAAYLRLKLSASEPLKPYPDQAAEIEDWLAELANLVVADWSNVPQRKYNNHEYWAAWSVMAVSVVSDDRSLFDWAVAQYDRAAQQVTDEGYLNNELRRKTRALFYHNYALPPLAMMAAFGQANGLDLQARGDHALSRLAHRVMAGLDDPEAFSRRAGADQQLKDFKPSKFTWLEPYCALSPCSGAFQDRLEAYRPLNNYRVGGDLTALFGPRQSSESTPASAASS
ncbi:MAG: mannuronate-specific alginate lyase [Pseudomonadota bacterium]|nr:mannuronate-specific alginate lyase [Pseudomonadota bacterium]